MNEQANTSKGQLTDWRINLGVVLLVLSVLLPVLGIPVVTGFQISSKTTAVISGAFLLGGEVLGIIAIAVMGNSGYLYLKNSVMNLLKRYGPPENVSRTRYTIGLIMFCLPLIFGWISIYTARLIPGFIDNPLPYAIAGDLLLLLSFFVLGGNFWEKIRSLFIHNAEVQYSKNETL